VVDVSHSQSTYFPRIIKVLCETVEARFGLVAFRKEGVLYDVPFTLETHSIWERLESSGAPGNASSSIDSVNPLREALNRAVQLPWGDGDKIIVVIRGEAALMGDFKSLVIYSAS
jgi:hypothetical protein